MLVTKIVKDAGYDCGLIGKLHLSSAEGGVEKRTDDGYNTFYYSHDSTPKLNPETDDYKRWIVEEKKQNLKKKYIIIISD